MPVQEGICRDMTPLGIAKLLGMSYIFFFLLFQNKKLDLRLYKWRIFCGIVDLGKSFSVDICLMDENFMCRCIPYRYRKTNKSKELEVLVISSQNGKGMLFPKVLFALACRMWLFYFLVLVNPLVITCNFTIFTKRPLSLQGGWEMDEDMKDAALRETFEEAGVRGVVEVSIFIASFH